MHVTFVAPNYLPSVGGAQLLVQRVAEGLVSSHGHRVQVITTDARLSPGGPDAGRVGPERELIDGVDVLRLPVARRCHRVVRQARQLSQRLSTNDNWVVRASQPVASGPLGARLARRVAEAGRSSDVLVGVSSAFLTLPATRSAARRGGSSLVTLPLLHLSAGGPPAPSMRAIRAAETTVALTGFERQWLVAHGVSDRSAVVIPAGCDPSAFPDASAADARAALGMPERPTVGYVGRMAAHKGIDTLVGAMERVWRTHPDVNLLLAGNHTGWPEYDGLVRRASLVAGDRLIVREGFTEADKSSLFSACDVIAFPSRAESFGMVTLEGWCARRPVVVGDIGAVRSLVRSEVDAVLAPVGEPGAWSDALGALLDDEPARRRLGRAGRERVEAEFSWSRVVDDWHTVLLGASARSRCGGPVEAR